MEKNAFRKVVEFFNARFSPDCPIQGLEKTKEVQPGLRHGVMLRVNESNFFTMKISLLIHVLCFSVWVALTSAAEVSRVNFVKEVKPLLTSKCVNCHYSGALFGELNLENRTMAFKKRVNGPVILAGSPDSSMLYLVLKLPPKNLKAMPPNGHRVSDQEMKLIYDWIKQGASWPEGVAGVIAPLKSE